MFYFLCFTNHNTRYYNNDMLLLSNYIPSDLKAIQPLLGCEDNKTIRDKYSANRKVTSVTIKFTCVAR